VAKELSDGKENGCVVLFHGFVILDTKYALLTVSDEESVDSCYSQHTWIPR